MIYAIKICIDDFNVFNYHIELNNNKACVDIHVKIYTNYEKENLVFVYLNFPNFTPSYH